MEFTAKFFDELTTAELYEILRVRMAVFVVEQNCIYQDLDERDQRSLHVFHMEDGKVTAYLRAFFLDEERGIVRIGRVLTAQRGKGLGRRVLDEGIRLCAEKLHAKRIDIEAQCYAIGFYEKAGFRVCSEEFLDDGIPHIGMTKSLV